MKRLYAVWVGIPALLLVLAALPAACAPPVVGGACAYRDVACNLAITGVEQTEASQGQRQALGFAGFEVRYRLDPACAPEFSWAREGVLRVEAPGKSYFPGKAFLEKYGIEIGKTYPCDTRIITKGTCTPFILEIPGIDTRDDFELMGTSGGATR